MLTLDDHTQSRDRDADPDLVLARGFVAAIARLDLLDDRRLAALATTLGTRP